jgi:uncharacterized membrane protein YphA (DoxX/SURF4 family)
MGGTDMPPATKKETPRREVDTARLALRVVAVGVGVFFLGMSFNKLAWLADPAQLTQRFQQWLPNASPYAQVYLHYVAIPGGAIFARVVPIAEFLTALSMLTGVYSNVAAIAALFMILNFHVATSTFSSVEFLRDATGPPLIAALVALAIAGRRLPYSLRFGAPKGATETR